MSIFSNILSVVGKSKLLILVAALILVVSISQHLLDVRMKENISKQIERDTDSRWYSTTQAVANKTALKSYMGSFNWAFSSASIESSNPLQLFKVNSVRLCSLDGVALTKKMKNDKGEDVEQVVTYCQQPRIITTAFVAKQERTVEFIYERKLNKPVAAMLLALLVVIMKLTKVRKISI